MDIEHVKQILDKTEKRYNEVVKEKEVLENTIINNRFILKKKLSDLRIKSEKLLRLELCKIENEVPADLDNLEDQLNLLSFEMLKLDNEIMTDITNLENQLKLLKDKEIALLDKSKRFAKIYMNNFYKNISTMEWVTNIPKINTGYTNGSLYSHSALNVDEIGNIICYLLKKEEGKNFTSRRIDVVSDGYYHFPALAIREVGNDNIDSYDSSEFREIMCNPDDSSIIINDFYDSKRTRCAYLYDHPFISYFDNDVNSPIDICSNYKILLSCFEGKLAFDYKNHEIIRELIYSLANYQLVNNIKYMSAEQTQEVFKKLYKSR